MRLKRNEKLQNVVDGQYFRKNEIIEKDINMYYDFNTMIKEYIVANSGKDVTRGQISGAVSQLVDTKEIVRVGRGLYAKDMKVTANKKKSNDDEVKDTLKIQIYNTLIKVEKELATTISSVDIWKLNGENFEIVTKMRELKDSIEEIKTQCK